MLGTSDNFTVKESRFSLKWILRNIIEPDKREKLLDQNFSLYAGKASYQLSGDQ